MICINEIITKNGYEKLVPHLNHHHDFVLQCLYVHLHLFWDYFKSFISHLILKFQLKKNVKIYEKKNVKIYEKKNVKIYEKKYVKIE